MLGGVAAAAACCVVGWGAAGSAGAFVAPVSAGPPKPPKPAQLDFDGFFPTLTEIHVGDSVRFSINGFHTVTFVPKGQPVPALIVLSSANPISGRLDASGAPFWFNGHPNQIINPQAGAPAGGKTYDGTAFLNSGLPSHEGPPKPFVVRFTKAGLFKFTCIPHPGMNGFVKVVGKGKAIPSAAADRAAAAQQEQAGIAQARVLAKVKPAAATVLAGNDRGSVTWLRFFPRNLTVKAGTSVEFKMAARREVHTFTFGPAAYTGKIDETFTAPLPGGTGGPPPIVLNPLGAYPSDPLPLPPFTASNHGNGFEGSGLLSIGGPLGSSVKITFTTPGVYSYECVVHHGMDGKVTVTK